jgi:hypothetical protein
MKVTHPSFVTCTDEFPCIEERASGIGAAGVYAHSEKPATIKRSNTPIPIKIFQISFMIYPSTL